VVLGANGAMGYRCGAQFAASGLEVTFLARTIEKAREGLKGAIRSVRSSTLGEMIQCGDYVSDLPAAAAEADLIFEAVAENLAVKRALLEQVDLWRGEEAIVATATSGLSIRRLAEGRSQSFQRHFIGLHFFNPPSIMAGLELIAGEHTEPALVDFLEAFCEKRLGRIVVRAADAPGFAGNRVGFKVLNEAAQLAERHGPVFVDRLIGPYTGRAMSPLATIDLVGWDVHAAIVDNIHANAPDEARSTLRLPDYMRSLMERGILGRKAGGGFFGEGPEGPLALDPASGAYRPVESFADSSLDFIDAVKRRHHVGDYRGGLAILASASGEAAALARRVLAGYLSYAFHRAGEVTATIRGIDLIMGAGFNWAPPSALIDVLGLPAAVRLMDEAGLPVPTLLEETLRQGRKGPLFQHPRFDIGRFFVAR